MSTKAKMIELQIFGRALKINCPVEHESDLRQAAQDLQKRLENLKQRAKVSNTEQLIMAVALNLSYELSKEKAKTQDYAVNMEQRIKNLQETIEKALLK